MKTRRQKSIKVGQRESAWIPAAVQFLQIRSDSQGRPTFRNMTTTYLQIWENFIDVPKITARNSECTLYHRQHEQPHQWRFWHDSFKMSWEVKFQELGRNQVSVSPVASSRANEDNRIKSESDSRQKVLWSAYGRRTIGCDSDDNIKSCLIVLARCRWTIEWNDERWWSTKLQGANCPCTKLSLRSPLPKRNSRTKRKVLELRDPVFFFLLVDYEGDSCISSAKMSLELRNP